MKSGAQCFGASYSAHNPTPDWPPEAPNVAAGSEEGIQRPDNLTQNNLVSSFRSCSASPPTISVRRC
jgi:hypothetical protein